MIPHFIHLSYLINLLNLINAIIKVWMPYIIAWNSDFWISFIIWLHRLTTQYTWHKWFYITFWPRYLITIRVTDIGPTRTHLCKPISKYLRQKSNLCTWTSTSSGSRVQVQVPEYKFRFPSTVPGSRVRILNIEITSFLQISLKMFHLSVLD